MQLFFFSFLILFFELTLIRYIPAHVRATAYFANLIIMATFLGMGMGTILSSKRRADWVISTFPFLLYLLLVCVHFFSNCQIDTFTGEGEFFWPTEGIHNARVLAMGMFWVITIFFLLTTAIFIPLGYGMGREFRRYEPLVAYSLDILGSILGIATIGALSLYWSPPWFWVLCGGAVFVFLVRENRRILILSVSLMILNALMAYLEDGRRDVTWSPYYKITVGGQEGRPVYVNDAHHQNMVDMRLDRTSRPRFFQQFADDYHRPYRFMTAREEVLILGAGTGNDVAVALMKGAKHVDAVEIDPVILSIGGEGHPNEPYQNDHVKLYNTDARVFLKNTTKRYDLIVYATLDSHTILAGQTNMRLDNYLYTVEALRDVKRLLKEDGIFLLQFLAKRDYIATRLYRLVETVFGQAPRTIYLPEFRHFNHALLIARNGSLEEDIETSSPLVRGTYKLPTDDWPFLYLRKPFIPRHYIHFLLMILVIALAGIGTTLGKNLFQNIRPVMFFLGMAFLLLETKSITEFSLLFGSTWVVNVFVILGILIVILLANLLLLRFPRFPRRVLFVGLIGTMILCYMIPTRQLLGENPLARDLVTMVFTGLPILFAAGLFASCFKDEGDSAMALGWNLLGAVVGGLLEYSGMLVGIKALYIIAMCLYWAAGIGMLSQGKRISAVEP